MELGTDSGSEDDREPSLYPLEGKYKDHEDKARLLAMTEIDREAVLAERAAQIEREGQDRHLRNLLKARRAAVGVDAAASTRKSLRTKSAPKKSEEATKRGKLDELRRNREERKATGRRSSFGEEDASKKMLSEGEEDYDDSQHRPKDERPITLDDVNRCRIGRTALAKYFDYPGFEDVIPDVFVRLTIWDKETQKNVYRMAQIKGTVSISSSIIPLS
jgi:RNA polymerase-associated protein RTF1